MANNTTRNITYPTSGDSISPLETVFATLASTTDAAMGNLDASDIKTGALAIARGGTGATTASAALTALNAVSADGYYVAGKNKLINSDFTIWQRGTSLSNTGYIADRWRYVATGGTSKAMTQSRQTFTPGSQPVAGQEGKYFYRIAVTTAGSGYTAEYVEQPIEDARTLAGKKVVVSFWAKVASGTMAVTPQLVQNFGTGGAPSASVTSSFTAVSVGTSWTRYTATLTTTGNTVPQLAGKTFGTNDDSFLSFRLVMPNNTAQTLDLWGVQLEEGLVATNYTTNGVNKSDELASCQRYYHRYSTTTTGYVMMPAAYYSATVAYAVYKLPVSMRAIPSVTINGTSIASTTAVTGLSVLSGGATRNITNAASSASNTNEIIEFSLTTAASTIGYAAFVRLTSGSANYVDFSAEF